MDMFMLVERTIPSALRIKDNLTNPKQESSLAENRYLTRLGCYARYTPSKYHFEETSEPFSTKCGKVHHEGRGAISKLAFERTIPSISRRENGDTNACHLPDIQERPSTKHMQTSSRSRHKERIVNIKFWRGTSPLLFSSKDISSVHGKKMSQEQNPIQNLQNTLWTSKFQIGTGHQQQYHVYDKNLSLRDRLMEFEEMHYREAVTRINRYRKKLRQSTHDKLRPVQQNRTAELALDIPTAEEEKSHKILGSSSPPSIRMSPSKEWKPCILDRVYNKGTIAKTKHFDRYTVASEKVKPGKATKSHKYHALTSRREGSKQQTQKSVEQCHILGEKVYTESTTRVISSNEKSREDNSTAESILRTNKALTQSKNKIFLEIEKNKAEEMRQLQKNLNNQTCQAKLAREETKKERRSVQKNPQALTSKTVLGSKLRLLLQNSSQYGSNHSKLQPSGRTLRNLPPKGYKISTVNVSKIRPSTIPSRKLSLPNQTKIEGSSSLQRENQKEMNAGTVDEKEERGQDAEIQFSFKMKLGEPANADKSNYYAGQKNRQARERNTLLPSTYKDFKTSISRGKINIESSLNGISVTGLHGKSATSCNTESAEQTLKKIRNASTSKKASQKSKTNGTENQNKEKNLQNDKMMEATKMAFDSQTIPITSLSTEILNRELTLRAPSSSPVDFLQYFHPDILMQKAISKDRGMLDYHTNSNMTVLRNGKEHEQTASTAKDISPSRIATHRQLTLNPPIPALSDPLNHRNQYQEGQKGFTAPTIKGISSNYHYILKQQQLYHYPHLYFYASEKDHDEKAPIHIVSGVKKIPEKKKLHMGQKRPQSTAAPNIIHRTPFHNPREDDSEAKKSNCTVMPYQGYNGVRGVTVAILKGSINPLPQLVPLELMKEH